MAAPPAMDRQHPESPASDTGDAISPRLGDNAISNREGDSAFSAREGDTGAPVLAAVALPIQQDGFGAEGTVAGDGLARDVREEEDGYPPSFAPDGSPPGSDWSPSRWEHRRNQRRLALPLPPMESVPVSGFATPAADHQTRADRPGRKKLSPGVIRNRVGTWVTNAAGKSAFYIRKAVEVGSFDFDSCGEYPPAYPSHESFEDTLDEDEYSIESCPCTGSFSFTLHPEEYQSLERSTVSGENEDSDADVDDYGDGVPVSSVSIRRTPANHAQDIGTTWVSQSWLGQQQDGAPIPARCAALISLATSVDDALGHISTLYHHRERFDGELVSLRSNLRTHTLGMADKINSLWGQLVQRTSSLSESMDERVSSILATKLLPIQQAVSDMDHQLNELSSLLASRVDALERRYSDHEDVLASLTARVSSLEVSLSEHRTVVDAEFVAMNSRIVAIPTRTGEVPLSKSGRASLSALEKSAKKRLTDHAAKLADTLHRKRDLSSANPKPQDDGGRQTDTSVASASQYSQDAPADHEGLPRSLRGGGGMESPSASPSRSASVSASSSPPSKSVTTPPSSMGASDTVVASHHSAQPTTEVVDSNSSQVDPSVAAPRVPRFPTPWANSSFYARNNPSDRSSQQSLTGRGDTDGEAPPVLRLHGCTYTRKEVDSLGQEDIIAPPLPTDALSVSPMGKVWHGGGSLQSFGSGERVLSHEAVASLGVPLSVIPGVVASHAQISGIWNRPLTGFSHDRSTSYDPSMGRSPSYLQSDALKFTGWTDLPQSGVTPEKWVEFYTALQLMALQYGLGLMPFEGLDLQYAQGGHAFCLCGLGYRVFRQMGSSLFLIIQKLVPTSDPQVVSKVQSVAQSGGNGFELLWLLTKHFVPMVSVTRQLTWPVWPDNDDIFLFARRVALYCNLSRMRGQTPLTESQRSEMFLSKVEGIHRERAQHLLTTLRVSVSTSLDGRLSPDLRLHLNDLAERLMEELQDATVGLSTSMVSFPSPLVSPSTHSLLHSSDRPHIQGYCVNVARAGKSIRRAPPNPERTASRRGTSRTRRPPFDGNCDACGKYGHEAVSCDALGMAIYMRLYCSDKRNKPIMDEAEQNWNEKNKKWVTDSPPRKILARYCSVVGVPETQVDSELDWDMLYSEEMTEEDAAHGGDVDTSVCHRVALPAAVDWFNRSSSVEGLDAPEWVPHSCRVCRSPAAPQGSLLDLVPSQSPQSDFILGDMMDTEDEIPDDLPSFSTPDGISMVEGAPVREVESVSGVFGTEPSRSLAVTEWLWIRDPIPTIPAVSSLVCSRVSTFTLADSGSNVCLTNDLSILEDVHDIVPSPLDVAVTGSASMCTKSGIVTFTFKDGTVHRQPFLYNAQAAETILSPQHITKSSSHISTWVQGGSSDGSESGYLLFYGLDQSTVVMTLPLVRRNGLYYYSLSGDTSRVDPTGSGLTACRASRPVSSCEQLTSELWAARLGYCGTEQLSLIPAHTVGTPSAFKCHPFRFLDVKEDAKIQRQPRGPSDESVLKNGEQFHMDFGFIRASSSDYGITPPANPEDRVVYSFDGYNSYLLIMDRRSKRGWIFLRKTKEPPVDLVHIFLKKFGLPLGGVIRCDQGGELARSAEFRTMALGGCLYVVEPTGADSPSQNGGAERWNGSLATTVRALLYGAGLPPKYWSAALLHAMYLHNRRVHVTTRMTPYEAWHGHKPDLSRLRVFGSRVSVKKTGERSAKLDLHAYHGIFIGYSATDKNIRYIDLDSGVVKTCHHAVFDEAWYTQPRRPPTAQHLYQIGLSPPEEISTAPTPTVVSDTDRPSTFRTNNDAKVVHDFDITHRDLRQVYFSPSPFNAAFEEILDKKYLLPGALARDPYGGLEFLIEDNRLYLNQIKGGSPFAQLMRWRSRLRGAWLIQIDDVPIDSMDAVSQALSTSTSKPGTQCILVFSHSEVQKAGLTSDGIPQIAIDQMNPLVRLGYQLPQETIDETVNEPQYRIISEGDSSSLVSNATRLTRGKLMKQADWEEWSTAEKLQWDQYEAQGMLGVPCPLPYGAMKFNIVWQYDIKHDGRKKARATCDGSTRGNVVRVLDHTYAGTPDHVGQRIFYGTCAAENLLVYGSDASNAFAEAGPPRQGINLLIDRSFREWWVSKGRSPLPDGWVVPLLSAMQGHPESPRLWERHIDKIIRSLGLQPTTHEPCLYSGVIDGKRVLLLRQVDDFAVGAPDASTCDLIFDKMDKHLKIPLKRLGLVTMYNGVNIDQTKHYVKISCESYIEKISAKHLDSWMRIFTMPTIGPTPLPTTSGFMKSFLAAEGVETGQKELESRMRLSYRSGVGELIYALVTCRPDISHAVVRCAQNCICPHELHYHAVKHVLKYLYLTKSEGLYFWREQPNDHLPDKPAPILSSTAHDLLMEGRPHHGSTSLHGFVDSDWATCPKTRRSMTGICIRLAGGTIAYKTKLQPTVAQSSTEAEFMGASDFGKMMLYIRSILWDLGVPQESASFLYEDNDACTAMAMAQKPTTRTRHMDIKFHALCEWVERDLIKLERIDTTINMADHFTKSLSPILFRRHTDYIMGRVPPNYSQCNPTFRLSNKGDERRMDQALAPVVNRLVHTWTTIIGSSAS